jgi:hypothetical protein
MPHWDAIESRRQAFLADLGSTSPGALAFRPGPGAWSLEDVAQHLWLVERGTVHVLRSRAEKPSLPRDPFSPLKLAAMRAIVPRGIRIKAPVPEIIPQRRMPVDEVAPAWEATRAELRDVLTRLAPERLETRIFRHPLFGPLSVVQTVEFLGLHHDHHGHQVRRIRAAAGYPG